MLAFEAFADKFNFFNLIEQLTKLVIDPVLVQLAAVDVVTAGAMCT